MAAWLANAWGQVWPNLIADALWVPIAAWWAHSRAHRLIARHTEQVEKALAQHRQELHLYLGDKPGLG